jgi:hypothetical protein
MIKTLTTAFALLLTISGCSEHSPIDSTPEIPFDRLPQSEYLWVLEPGARVFRTQQEWTEFWSAHINAFDGTGKPVSAPLVDFDNYMLAGVFWGGSDHSGCSNQADVIQKAEVVGGVLQIEVDNLRSLGPCRMIVSPLDIVILPKCDFPVSFVGKVPM